MHNKWTFKWDADGNVLFERGWARCDVKWNAVNTPNLRVSHRPAPRRAMCCAAQFNGMRGCAALGLSMPPRLTHAAASENPDRACP